MELQLADIATNEKHLLKGFKVLGVFPFYLNYIRVDTQIQLSKIQTQIEKVSEKKASIDDFSNSEIQEKFVPLFKNFCLTGLINFKDRDRENRQEYSRISEWAFNKFVVKKLTKKINECGYKQLYSLYAMIRKLNDPSFFLACWSDLKRKENTKLSVEK